MKKRDVEATRGLFSASTVSAETVDKRSGAPADNAPTPAPDNSLFRRETASADDLVPTRPSAPTRAPMRIDRYIVERVIGEGGMGRVYKAHDPELDRVVALKVVRDQRVSEAFQLRMLREAQAMARLQHANVVTVHDVGLFEDRLYIAMDFIDGETLSAWLRSEPRSVDAILDAFLGAGEGLAAAHEVGLVHRDFKPSNAIVGADGVVRILDFGLVRRAGADDDDTTRASNSTTLYGNGSALATSLTVTGAFMGTPAYMSPEQFMSVEPDARSDQFSFCVALYEALYGEHPFIGATIDELRDALLYARRSARPSRARVPRWLGLVIERGLETNRERRWPTMDALLSRLRADPRRRRRRALGLGLALTAVGTAGYVTAAGLRPEVCAGAERALSELWGDEARASVRSAFAGAARAYERQQEPLVVDALDGYARAWSSARARACQDYHQRVISEARYDSATRCLARRRDSLAAVVDSLQRGQGVGDGVTMVERLPSIPDCADPARLDVRFPAPRDPAVLEQLAQLERRLAELVVRMQTRRHKEAYEELRALSPEIEATGYVPLILEYRRHRLDAPGRDAEPLNDLELAQQMLTLALESSDDEAAVTAIVAMRLGGDTRPEALGAQTRVLTLLAEALLERSGLHDRMAAVDFYRRQQGVMFLLGRMDEARAYAEKTVAVVARAEDATWVDRVQAMLASAEVFQRLHDLNRAETLTSACLDELRDRNLTRHPFVADVYMLQGGRFARLGDDEAALERFDHAIELYRDAGLNRSAMLTMQERAVIRERRGDVEGALADFQALAERVERPDRDPTRYIVAHNSVAVSLDRLGRHEEAIEQIERALEMVGAFLTADHPLILGTRLTLADALLHNGAYEAARAEYREVSRIYSARGEQHPLVVYPIAGLGLVALAQGRHEDARAQLEDALARRIEQGESPELLGETRFALARALRPPGQEVSAATEERARSLGAAALADFEAAGPLYSSARAEVARWLETLEGDAASG